jgi:hypothetical protein
MLLVKKADYWGFIIFTAGALSSRRQGLKTKADKINPLEVGSRAISPAAKAAQT